MSFFIKSFVNNNITKISSVDNFDTELAKISAINKSPNYYRQKKINLVIISFSLKEIWLIIKAWKKIKIRLNIENIIPIFNWRLIKKIKMTEIK